MSFTIVPDESAGFRTHFHVRARLATRLEFEELIAALTRRLQAATAQEENHDRIDNASSLHPALGAHDSNAPGG